ncbi:hypothetical protein IM40_08375 [Candidatus Paracaedimonas acanthamoebae]|nr:hypothetical protein IM40_08375 [Candidatus Paracaedimonas acanthamoebae]
MKRHFLPLILTCMLSFSSLSHASSVEGMGNTALEELSHHPRRYYPAQLEEAQTVFSSYNTHVQKISEDILALLLEHDRLTKQWALGTPVSLGCAATIASISYILGGDLLTDFLMGFMAVAVVSNFYSAYKTDQYYKKDKKIAQLCEELLTGQAHSISPEMWEARLMTSALKKIDYRKYMPEGEETLTEVAEGVHYAFGQFIAARFRLAQNNVVPPLEDGAEKQMYKAFADWGIIRRQDVNLYYEKMFGYEDELHEE